MRFSQFDRRFWLVLLATLVCVSVTASMGFWQLRRADYKESLQRLIDQRQTMPALALTDVAHLHSTEDVWHRLATVRGQWMADATVFLDNRQMEQRQGFYVVTPLKLEQGGRVLLVQRGFVPRDFMDRTKVPQVPTPAGWVEITGRLAGPPSRVYELGASGTGLIRQNLDMDAFASELKADVILGSLVQLQPDSLSPDDGLERRWPPVTAGVHKHHGYAFQWFGLSALMVCLYVWFQIISPRRRRAAHDRVHRG